MKGMPTGRPRKPTRLKLLEGERPDRRNDAAPVPSTSAVEPPTYLSESAREHWDRLAPDLIRKQVLTAWDADLFAVLCQAIADYAAALYVREQVGQFVKGQRGGVVRSPAVPEMRRNAEIIAAIGARFGLNPADRDRLTADVVDAEPRSVERLLSGPPAAHSRPAR